MIINLEHKITDLHVQIDHDKKAIHDLTEQINCVEDEIAHIKKENRTIKMKYAQSETELNKYKGLYNAEIARNKDENA